jgi:hypothetical protein
MLRAELEGRMMATMHAMVLDAPRTPLVVRARPLPDPN